MRNGLYIIGIIACLIVLAFFVFRTPDTNPAEMAQKYGLGTVERICYGEGNCIRIREDGYEQNPTIVLIHGSSDSLLTWRSVIDRLEGDYRILTLDMPGHGLSGPHINDDYSASAMMEAVTALVNHKDVDTFVIGGNSMGGWISWRYALAHPDRVNGLILMDASGAPLPADAPEAKLYLGARLLRLPLMGWLMERITPQSFIRKSLEDTIFDNDLITEDMVTEFWELLRYPGNRRATYLRSATDRNISYAERLPEITAPALIIWGQEDYVVPVEAASVFDERLPNSQKIVLDNVAHLPQREAPDTVAQEITRFMRQVYDR